MRRGSKTSQRDERRLAAAFRATDYRVRVEGRTFVLRLDAPRARWPAGSAFRAWLEQRGLASWAIVTADNPGGRRRSPARNRAAKHALRRILDAHGWRHVPACNRARYGNWPDEEAFCVFAADLRQLRAVAASFGQAAIVIGDRVSGAPRLLWLAGNPAPECAAACHLVCKKS